MRRVALSRIGRSGLRDVTAVTAAAHTTRVADDDALANLRKVDHIVVLMLENRSFDHMLGFLRADLGRQDVEGPDASVENKVGTKGYAVHPAKSTKLVKAQDPCHSGWCVDEQVADGEMSGFAANYAKTRPKPPFKGDSPATVMAYHTAKQLPVYAYLADTFCVCDHWFCSVGGATMPNRCYAAAGTSGGHRDNLKPSRPWNLASFVRHLDAANVQWRWYSHDYVPTLWIIDPLYGLSGETLPSYFDRQDPLGHRSFLQRAAKGDLPAVSWIDPNFIDLSFGPEGSNDDHPPSDLRAGQMLALKAFHAVVRSPAWPKTLLLITYDEHGGFYDHVAPPAAQDDSKDNAFHRLGPRVPAIVVSPLVAERQVATTVLDHTSIIKTILARFCRKKDGTVPDMGARVRAAAHLGGLLGGKPRAAPPQADYQRLIDQAAKWQSEFFTKSIAHQTQVGAEEPELTDWQEEFLGARNALLARRGERGIAPPPPSTP
ncbi:MAG: alkaline phosphatase family protein [Gaiellaceae bacterium]